MWADGEAVLTSMRMSHTVGSVRSHPRHATAAWVAIADTFGVPCHVSLAHLWFQLLGQFLEVLSAQGLPQVSPLQLYLLGGICIFPQVLGERPWLPSHTLHRLLFLSPPPYGLIPTFQDHK